jgi:hypothetical protein
LEHGKIKRNKHASISCTSILRGPSNERNKQTEQVSASAGVTAMNQPLASAAALA